MTPEARRRYFNECDPDAPVDPDDPRASDIDQFNDDERGPVRGRVWVDVLAQELTLSELPLCELFTGLPGSGKSTLLRRLKRELERPSDGASKPFLCVLVNVERWLDAASPVDIADILLAVVYETERAVLTLESKDPDEARHDTYLSRLWQWIAGTDVELRGIDLNFGGELAVPEVGKVSAGAKALLELKSNPTLRERVRTRVAERTYAFLSRVREYLGELVKRVRAHNREGVVVIVDSLEKLRGVSTNFNEVLNSAERIFAQGAPHMRLADSDLGKEAPRIHVIYTLPPALAFRRAVQGLHFLPMIKLHDSKDVPYAPGYKAARDLIERRIPMPALCDIFGAPNVESRCHELITWSGGYPRDIVRLLRECVKQTEAITNRLFARLLANASEAYRRVVTVETLDWLAEVSLHRDLRQRDTPEHRQLVDRALSDNLVLRYRNDDEWFNLHPALLTMPGLEEAKQAYKRSKQESPARDQAAPETPPSSD